MIRIRKFIKKPSKWPAVSIALVMALALVLGTATVFAVDPSPSPCTNSTATTSSDAVGTIYTMYVQNLTDVHPDLDLWDPREIGVEGVLWDYFPAAEASGTGVFDTYLALKSQGNDWDEQGYNTGREGVQSEKCNDYNVDDSKTSALPLSAVPIVTIDMDDGEGPIAYREFVCDINEVAGDWETGDTDQYLSLDVCQIWQSDDYYLCGTYDMEPDYEFDPVGPRLVYDLDCEENRTLILDYMVNKGSGKPDYQLYIPNSWFDQELDWVIMVIDHGNLEKYDPTGWPGTGDDSGFEEWGVKIIETGCLEITKALSIPAEVPLAPLDGTFTVHVENTAAGYSQNVTFTMEDGVILPPNPVILSGLTPGTYTLTEIGLPPYWEATGGLGDVIVSTGTTCANATVTNTFQTGCLNVTKEIDIGEMEGDLAHVGNTTFNITVTGPSYPSGTTLTFELIDGVLWGPENGNSTCLCNLIPGNY